MPVTAPAKFLIFIIVAFLSACSEPATDPEVETRAWLDAAEQALESRDLDTLANSISGEYLDSRGNDRLRILGLLRIYLLRNRSPALLIKIDNLRIIDAQHVELKLAVAAANAALPTVLNELRGRLLQVDLTLQKDGDAWQVSRADWEDANLGDLF